jgi:hypothetical protein
MSEQSDQLITEIEKVWKSYKKNPEKTEELKLSILEQVKNKPSDMWSMFFEADKSMYKRIELVKTLQASERYKEMYLKNSEFMDGVSSVAYVMCEIRDGKSNGLDSDKVKVWHDTFKDIPEFAPAFAEEIQYMIDMRVKVLEQAKAMQSPRAETPSLVEIISISVPYEFKKNGKKTTELHEGLIEQLVEDYNAFNLHGYMDLPFACIDTKMEAKDTWVFHFHVGEVLEGEKRVEAIKALKEELSGQLSDGWGESMEQIQVLEGSDIINPGFNYKKLVVLGDKKAAKNKMK